ncbi:MAG: NUDIX domain-containing protein [Gemmatimonadota bacterium]
MALTSAGIVMYRKQAGSLELFLVHPGGPYYARKDLGIWSFPKGEYSAGEDPLAVACREFEEETGSPVVGTFVPLTAVRQANGKIVSLWAVEGDVDAAAIRSNTFTMEWPPKSRRQTEFPEVDRAAWFAPDVAKTKLIPAQARAVDELCALLRT